MHEKWWTTRYVEGIFNGKFNSHHSVLCFSFHKASLRLHQATQLMRQYGQKCAHSKCNSVFLHATSRENKSQYNQISFVIKIYCVSRHCSLSSLSLFVQENHALDIMHFLRNYCHFHFNILLTMITLEKWLSGLFQS